MSEKEYWQASTSLWNKEAHKRVLDYLSEQGYLIGEHTSPSFYPEAGEKKHILLQRLTFFTLMVVLLLMMQTKF